MRSILLCEWNYAFHIPIVDRFLIVPNLITSAKHKYGVFILIVHMLECATGAHIPQNYGHSKQSKN